MRKTSVGDFRIGFSSIHGEPASRVEQAIGKLKRFKRIAVRYDKTTDNYAAFVALACALRGQQF
jgi:transposase